MANESNKHGQKHNLIASTVTFRLIYLCEFNKSNSFGVIFFLYIEIAVLWTKGSLSLVVSFVFLQYQKNQSDDQVDQWKLTKKQKNVINVHQYTMLLNL